MERYHISKLRALPIEGVAERLGLHVVRHSLPERCKDFSERYLQQISARKFGGVGKKL